MLLAQGTSCLLSFSSDSPTAVVGTPVEELTYRRSLRVALDLLNSSSACPCPEQNGRAPRVPEAAGTQPGRGAPAPAKEKKEEEEDVVCSVNPSRRPASGEPAGPQHLSNNIVDEATTNQPPLNPPAAPSSPPRARALDSGCKLPSRDHTGPLEPRAPPQKRPCLDDHLHPAILPAEPAPVPSPQRGLKACTPTHGPRSPDFLDPEQMEGGKGVDVGGHWGRHFGPATGLGHHTQLL